MYFVSGLSFTVVLSIITTVTVIVTVIISALNYLLTKKRLISEVISTNRMNWITQVREYCSAFIIELDKAYPDIHVLKELQIKILLYGRGGGPYDKLFNSLERGISVVENQGYNIDDKQDAVKYIIVATQEVLNDVWKRMKMEAGISED